MQMPKEFDAILNQSEAQPASSCLKEDGSISFLDQIILPIYTTMEAVSFQMSFGDIT